ncbi:hypothetical protein Tco_1337728 [Tanacetum coccineum]
MTLLAKVRCFLIQSGMSKVFWADDTTMSTYLVNRSPSSAIGFKTPTDLLGFLGWLASIKQEMLELVKVKCIFLICREGTGSMQVLHGFEFEVEPLGDHTFEVEPQENFDQGASLQEVQTQDLIDYQLARDREQHLAYELFRYREDSNETTFLVAAVDKIYAHESLTFNDTVASTVAEKAVMIAMTITGSMHQRSSGIRVDSLSGDYDVEKNGKRSYRYVVGSQEYQVICTIPDIASAGVDTLDGFDRSLQKNVQAVKEAIWPRGLLEELGVELNTVLEAKTVKFLKVGTEHNVADALTKVIHNNNEQRFFGVRMEYKPQGRKEKEGQEEEIRLEKRVWEAYTYNNENLHPSPSVVKGYLYPFALSEAYGLLNGLGLASRGL